MKNNFSTIVSHAFAMILCVGLIASPVLAAQGDPDDGGESSSEAGRIGSGENYCSQTAVLVLGSCEAGVRSDFRIAVADCVNLSDQQEQDQCLDEAIMDRGDDLELCQQQLQARLDVCNQLGQDRYDPEIDPANFVNPLAIGQGVQPNPYFPLVPGTQWVYEATSQDDEGEEVTETITVTVTEETKLIESVTCIVVTDVEMEDDQIIESTNDWYAQDVDGNVWYFGEIAKNFETFEGDDPENPELVNLEGSWKAGRDSAKPGILIPAEPQEGEVIRQEVALGEAEDLVEILSLTGTETAPAANCDGDCLVTRDFSPLEPGISEEKYYAPGVGLILELDEDGERGPELVSITQP
ncbi:hypothetical protein [Desulfocurvibacter africanus]|uniref:hypothetical protein n=1 Tax=Desulfocurvibacter africanus TaxID=873 RepID=UPI0004059A12|nr:hypothetical protein [Desulfocurvibacter africanus]